ncbi:MAG: agmatine deiminase family protein, partial [Spongiibacteraceae bacterium]|nr:agmatine deiminase family protein [Spongiibacteraceae bacterium]
MNDTKGAWRMPAEWEPHDRCWMAWPCNEALWGPMLARGRRSFAAVVRAISEFEPVTLLVRPEHLVEARQQCGDAVEYWEYPLDDSWMRDFGPSFVCNDSGEIAGIDRRFNGWGKYPHEQDRHVSKFVLERLGLPRIEVPL